LRGRGKLHVCQSILNWENLPDLQQSQERPLAKLESIPGWRRGVVASVVRRMNEVTLRRARLVLGWVTVFGRVYNTVRNQPTMSTQPCISPGR